MHDAHHVDMMLNVTSRPIIEDSNNIQVGCLDSSVSLITVCCICKGLCTHLHI